MIRTEEDTLRTMPFGPDADLELTTLDTNIDGDRITFNAPGRWKRTLQ
jgi:hypothetical protein